MPRIALCGGLMMGVDSTDPNTPPLLQAVGAGWEGRVSILMAVKNGWLEPDLGCARVTCLVAICMHVPHSSCPVWSPRMLLANVTPSTPDGEGAARHFVDGQSAVTRLAPEIIDGLQTKHGRAIERLMQEWLEALHGTQQRT